MLGDDSLNDITKETAKFLEGTSKEVLKEILQEDIKIPTELIENKSQEKTKKKIENPDFDFNDFYEKGTILYFVRIFPSRQVKFKPECLKVKSIYPRSMTLVNTDTNRATLVDYNQRNQLFLDKNDASAYYDSLSFIDEEIRYKEKSTDND